MGEYVDKLVRLQADELVALSLLERVRGYDRKVNGKTVHVSPHTRDGEGPGKAQKGEYKVFQKGKDVFTNEHKVDTADIHVGDRISVDPAGFKDVTGIAMDPDDSHYDARLNSEEVEKKLTSLASTLFVKSVHDSDVKVLWYDYEFKIPVEHITKVQPALKDGEKKLSKNAQVKRSQLTELNRAKISKNRIANLEESTGLAETTAAKDSVRQKEIELQLKKLQDELAEINRRNNARKKTP